ncbi:hypothetical protein SLE2022_342650 [Rubroshorea leprosula]
MMVKCATATPGEVQLFRTLTDLEQLAETCRFKAWFLDQWQTTLSWCNFNMHVPICEFDHFEKLATNGTKMVIISNSSRRASTTMTKMKSLGFDPSFFEGAVTSGELTHQYLQRRDDPWFAALGSLKVVENVEEAEFVLVHGTEVLGLPSGNICPVSIEDLEKILEQCTLAAKYEKLGGEVKWMGKPDKIIYKSAMAMVGVDASDSIAVGDSLHRDIKGANEAGIASAFITGGIHATELGLSSFGQVADLSSIKTLAAKYDAHPTYMLPAFAW